MVKKSKSPWCLHHLRLGKVCVSGKLPRMLLRAHTPRKSKTGRVHGFRGAGWLLLLSVSSAKDKDLGRGFLCHLLV